MQRTHHWRCCRTIRRSLCLYYSLLQHKVGLGRVIALSEEVHPSTKCVQLYNFSKEIQDSIVHLQLKDVPTTISPGEDNKQLTASQQLLVNGSDGYIQFSLS